MQGSLCCAIN